MSRVSPSTVRISARSMFTFSSARAFVNSNRKPVASTERMRSTVDAAEALSTSTSTGKSGPSSERAAFSASLTRSITPSRAASACPIATRRIADSSSRWKRPHSPSPAASSVRTSKMSRMRRRGATGAVGAAGRRCGRRWRRDSGPAGSSLGNDTVKMSAVAMSMPDAMHRPAMMESVPMASAVQMTRIQRSASRRWTSSATVPAVSIEFSSSRCRDLLSRSKRS